MFAACEQRGFEQRCMRGRVGHGPRRTPQTRHAFSPAVLVWGSSRTTARASVNSPISNRSRFEISSALELRRARSARSRRWFLSGARRQRPLVRLTHVSGTFGFVLDAVWLAFDTQQPLDGGCGWTAMFDRQAPDGGYAYYRLVLYRHHRVVAEVVARIDKPKRVADPLGPEELRGELARAAAQHVLPNNRWGRVVVDGATFTWAIEEDDFDYMAMSNRGLSGEDIVKVRGERGSSISLRIPRGRLDAPGWWRGDPSVTGLVVIRAIEIAARRGSYPCTLEGDELDEAFAEPRVLQAELDEAAAALAVMARTDEHVADETFIRCMLAIGCTDTTDDERARAIDDWVASHADVLNAARLQRVMHMSGTDDFMYRRRSALAFATELCARVNVDLGLDTASYDARIATGASMRPPWGIPPTHWWWRRP